MNGSIKRPTFAHIAIQNNRGIMELIFNELINWVRRCGLEQSDKLRIIEKIKWIREEIKTYLRVK